MNLNPGWDRSLIDLTVPGEKTKSLWHHEHPSQKIGNQNQSMDQGVCTTFPPDTDDGTSRMSWGTHPTPPVPFEKTLLFDFGANLQYMAPSLKYVVPTFKYIALKLKYVMPKFKYSTQIQINENFYHQKPPAL